MDFIQSDNWISTMARSHFLNTCLPRFMRYMSLCVYVCVWCIIKIQRYRYTYIVYNKGTYIHTHKLTYNHIHTHMITYEQPFSREFPPISLCNSETSPCICWELPPFCWLCVMPCIDCIPQRWSRFAIVNLRYLSKPSNS